jgi:predicted CopG family antitoxin
MGNVRIRPDVYEKAKKMKYAHESMTDFLYRLMVFYEQKIK